ncbi:Spiroplasmavirus-related protein [Spiroplasma kunkelii CR2-3x]|uniref:Spiroplasmavirus-related protein n=2 Tax=Spiroplasma kunkelii CR2-3x TaxID=273035 RepID=A0A0K2JHA9_SPIKU|nr:hypothetical protein [Spiroplasma kunkelii]ALA97626.1 Spiroplasmavirus-related protein [Spiroplasma kunkelii CR2-3x]
MLGMYLTTAVNFLANTPKTMTEGMTGIWTGLTSALWKVKEGITNILPEIMVFLGEAWIILIPFAIFCIIKMHRVYSSSKFISLVNLMITSFKINATIF